MGEKQKITSSRACRNGCIVNPRFTSLLPELAHDAFHLAMQGGTEHGCTQYAAREAPLNDSFLSPGVMTAVIAF